MNRPSPPRRRPRSSPCPRPPPPKPRSPSTPARSPGTLSPQTFRSGGEGYSRAGLRPGARGPFLHAQERAQRCCASPTCPRSSIPTTVAFAVAHGSRPHARGRAELRVRPHQHREAALALPRPGDHGRADARPERGNRRAARSSARRAGSSSSSPTAASASSRATAGVKLPSLPGGLISKPTLVWDIETANAGTAQGALHLPDRRHHVVGGLQPDLLGANAGQPASSTSARGSRS